MITEAVVVYTTKSKEQMIQNRDFDDLTPVATVATNPIYLQHCRCP